MFHRHIRQEKIVDYVLGKLSSKEHFRVNAHLAKCEQCSSERDYWQDHLHVESIPVPSIQLKRNIFANIQQKRARRKHPKIAYLVMSFCLLFLFPIGIWHISQTPTTSQPETAKNTGTNHDLVIQLPPAEEQSLHNMVSLLSTKPVKSNMTDDVNPNLQALIQYMTHETSESIHITNEIHLPTSYLSQTGQQLLVTYDHISYKKQEPIMFMNHQTLCIYEPEQKDLICVPIEIVPQTNHLVPIQEQIIRLKYP